MIILISLAVLLIVGLLLLKYYEYEAGVLGIILVIVATLGLLAGLITLAINPMVTKVEMRKLKAFEETVINARKPGISELENAAITAKKAEWNEWIAEQKYYNNTVFDIWIPDQIATIEPLK